MSKTEKGDQRKWIGYCPTCNAIFRLPAGKEGLQARCPKCNTMMVIPAPGEVVVTNLEEELEKLDELDQPVKALKGGGTWTTAPKAEKPKWEREVTTISVNRGAEVLAGVLLAVIALLAAGSILIIERVRQSNAAKAIERREDLSGVLMIQAGKDGGEPAGKEEAVEAPEVDLVLLQISETVNRFLSATTVEEMAEVVRGGPETLGRMEAYYRDRPLNPVPMRSVADDGKLRTEGKIVSVKVLLEDFTWQPIALERDGENFLVDWESWVGWGRVEWEELLATKPVEPVLMRVRCWKVEYYNYGFLDDTEWVSFRLESGDRNHRIYGYARRDSYVALRLQPEGYERRPLAAVLRVRYPRGAKRDDQVVIDSLVCTGWILPREVMSE